MGQEPRRSLFGWSWLWIFMRLISQDVSQGWSQLKSLSEATCGCRRHLLHNWCPWHGALASPRAYDLREQGRSCSVFYDRTPEATHGCFQSTQLVSQFSPIQNGGTKTGVNVRALNHWGPFWRLATIVPYKEFGMRSFQFKSWLHWQLCLGKCLRLWPCQFSHSAHMVIVLLKS